MSASRRKRRVEPLSMVEPASVDDQSGPTSETQGYQPVSAAVSEQFLDHTKSLYRRHIIIVEDETAIGLALELELEDADAVPIGPAISLIDALNYLDREPIDGAILDIDLNGVDVFPLADMLIEKGVCFVFHTAHSRRQELRDVYPGVPICSKPASASAVLQMLGKAFSERTRN